MAQSSRRYASVAAMVQDISKDKQFVAEFQRGLNRRRLVKRLFAIRTARGISQHAIDLDLCLAFVPPQA